MPLWSQPPVALFCDGSNEKLRSSVGAWGTDFRACSVRTIAGALLRCIGRDRIIDREAG